MTLEVTMIQDQPQITGNPECDNIQQVEITHYSQLLEIVDNQCNVPWIQANIQFLNTIKGVGISNIEKTSTVGIVDTYTITYTDGTTSTFDVTNGSVGAEGRGIVSIIKTSTQELTDTYTITYTDQTTSTFDVTNGLDGISVESITLYETVGLVDTYEIIYSSGSRSYFNVTNGKDGIGTDGRGIVSIIKTSTVGLVDTYTITYSDSTTSTFDVTNGEKGDDGTSAYQIYHAGGGTLSEVDFNESITDIPTHIEDATKHIDTTTAEFSGTIDETNDKFTIDETNDKFTIWDNSLLKWIRFSFTNLKTFIGTYFLKLDQTTPQTLTQSPKITSLTEGQLVYVNADKQLVPVNSVIWDDIKKQLQINSYTPWNDLYKLAVNGSLGIAGAFVCGGGVAAFGNTDMNFSRNSVYRIRNYNTGSNSALSFETKNIEAVRIDPNQNVGIGAIAPKSKLQVAGGIQCGDDTAVASADKVGTTRYRATANASFVEVCVRTGAATYAWHVLATYTW